ncbi:hypothetical protein BZG36_03365 [Bifiguratus adelaidae]|uniref:S-adenosyl-L-methionine-dependent tRNA 4-demethylwyosine synthase n=1 Tax=Bifiguratus adelaidae TaxID=1938954 RepID=A0A261XXK3_9FUNG|nr:hypothetical protein BZG36_03365 [Bifiguratus adelaidae]
MSFASLLSSLSNALSLGKNTACGDDCSCQELKGGHIKIFYGSLTGTAKQLAQRLAQLVAEHPVLQQHYTTEVIDVVEYDTEDFFKETSICFFLLSNYNIESPVDWFVNGWLKDARYDFRVDRLALQKIRYAVFGLGDSAFAEEDYMRDSYNVDKWLGQLGATRLFPAGEGDKNNDQEKQFLAWADGILHVLSDERELAFAPNHVEYDSEGEDVSEDEHGERVRDVGAGREDGAGISGDEVLDVEDIGKVASKIKTAVEQKSKEEEAYRQSQRQRAPNGRAKRTIGNGKEDAGWTKTPAPPREMVSPMLHKALTKQGYKIIGSHSGVKICRWTKSALRGRGFCYKHTFYGIQSHLCMETTPSLACANKCVFCWRHHTNPVGTEWRWKVDDPEFILDGAMQNHYKMIKQLKGVPGVKADRFQDAFTIRHCALSLVGEPIFYPHINEFVKLLHQKHISSFLVTNAQFPDKIAEMDMVTQLYVSVDASTKEALKKIDRPLFRDFWERFLNSLDALSAKGQRTVYRLTLVKDYNTEDLGNYVELISRGKPCFIEVKGVTYCGYSGASNLTMANVPYHNEVIGFCEDLVNLLGEGYEIASEHAHSCSVLIASTRFKKDGEWYTHIDYEKFFQLVESNKAFTALDFMAKTPDWAVFGVAEGGFDPEETRWYRKQKGDIGVAEQGC